MARSTAATSQANPMRSSSRIDEGRTLNPGLLRHQIIWQRKEQTPGSEQNTFGEDVFEWVDHVLCRAQIRSLTGRELEMAQQRWAEAKYAIRQHFTRGLTTTHRIQWNDDGDIKYLDPLEVSDLAGTRRVQDVIAKEWVP